MNTDITKNKYIEAVKKLSREELELMCLSALMDAVLINLIPVEKVDQGLRQLKVQLGFSSELTNAMAQVHFKLKKLLTNEDN